MQRRNLLQQTLALAGASLAAPWVHAQSAYPHQPLRWVVPYPAGGGTDVLARTVAEAMRMASLFGSSPIRWGSPRESTCGEQHP